MPISPRIADEVRRLETRQSQIMAFQKDWNDPAPRRDQLVEIQAEYDPTFRCLGAQAPPPGRPGEGLREYRGRLLSALLPYTQTYRNSNAFALAGTPVEAEARAEIERAVNDRHKGDPLTGAMRKVEVVEPDTGARRTEWRGDNADWMRHFMPPYQLATHIKVFDRRGVEAPLPIRWGSPPAPRR
jgi:hypothetical protein